MDDKKFYEKLAMEILNKYFPNHYDNALVNSDKPDLKCGNLQGVEVVQVIRGELKNKIEKMKILNSNSARNPKEIEKMLNAGDTCICEVRRYKGIEWKGYIAANELNIMIEKKLTKLNNGNYSSVEKVDLFVFSPEVSFGWHNDYNAADLRAELNALMNRERDMFRYIYIADLNLIWVYDVSKSKIKQKKIKLEEYRKIRNQGSGTNEGC
ncbi:hypothetical protein [Anaerorhabdus sp.]|uniref:hypothetical protein n=1 Tax=Anaerorhabdus sp. TaxID=1872524 RepID=UPI002FC965EC